MIGVYGVGMGSGVIGILSELLFNSIGIIW